VNLNCELKEVGCDYITATSPSPSFTTGLAEFGSFLVREQTRQGAKRRDSKAGGYQTMSAGSVSVGVRYDGALVRVWGEVAKENWSQVVDLASNITRFDAQLTGEFEGGPSKTMEKIWKQNRGWTSGSGRRSKVKERSGPSGIESMEFCSRQSEFFARIYDKFLQSKLPWYENCLRFELELKGSLAYQYSRALTLKPDPEQELFNYILDWSKNKLQVCILARGCASSAPSGCERLRSRRLSADCYRSLEYLKKQVSPLIQRLSAAGYRNQCLEVLGLQEPAAESSDSQDVADSYNQTIGEH